MQGYFQNLYRKAQDWQIAFNSSFGFDISTPAARRKAVWHTHLVDHAFLRKYWTNMYPLGATAQAWRSNQPGPGRIARLRETGIRSIINLRGRSAFAVYLFEEEACARHGITLIDHQISAYRLSSRERYMQLFALFDRVERPFLMHCKSGADRSGIAAALYLMDQENLPVEQAMGELALKYLHRKNSKAGILDFLLESYAADSRDHTGNRMPIRRWISERYDQAALTAQFAEKRRR